MREPTDTELEELAAFAAEVLGDIADDRLQDIYELLRLTGAPAAEIEAARLELDRSVNAMVEARLAELLSARRTLH